MITTHEKLKHSQLNSVSLGGNAVRQKYNEKLIHIYYKFLNRDLLNRDFFLKLDLILYHFINFL